MPWLQDDDNDDGDEDGRVPVSGLGYLISSIYFLQEHKGRQTACRAAAERQTTTALRKLRLRPLS